MSRALWRSLFSFDPRPAAEVEDDMRAEFDAHIALLEDELLSQGVDPSSARDQALARFGDPRRLSREGRNIKLGDRIMLQRINLALLVILGAAVIFLLVQNQRISNRSVATLEQLTASLTALQQRQSVPTTAVTPEGPRAKVVYVDGLVDRPGTYTIPPGGISLRRLLAGAGGIKPGGTTVYLDHNAETDADAVFSVSDMDVWADPGLKADDVITVTDQEDRRAPWRIKLALRGYVGNPSDVWFNRSDADLATLLAFYTPQPEATLVRVERATPEPWSITLPVGQATANAGKEVQLLHADIITALGPEADAAAPKEWQTYVAPDQVVGLSKSDKVLAALVLERSGLDHEYAQRSKAGYPPGHARIQEVRERARDAEVRIVHRVTELLKSTIDELVKSDEVLRDLVQKRAALETQMREDLRKNVSTGIRNTSEFRQKLYPLNVQINTRVEELQTGKAPPSKQTSTLKLTWIPFVPSDELKTAAEHDGVLSKLIEERQTLDKAAADFLANSVPFENRDFHALLQRVQAMEAQIKARESELAQSARERPAAGQR